MSVNLQGFFAEWQTHGLIDLVLYFLGFLSMALGLLMLVYLTIWLVKKL